jgi:ATP-dependent protease HslVU (ClpYQ) peptidase subunit
VLDDAYMNAFRHCFTDVIHMFYPISYTQATLLVADAHHTFEITGNGDVLEPPTNAMGMSTD